MPKVYVRKYTNSRGEWTVEQLMKAIKAIKQKDLSIREASKKFGIPWTTLKRRMQKNYFTKHPPGPSSILGYDNEKKLVLHIKKLHRCGFQPTSNEIRSIAYKFAEQLNLRHNFSKAREMAGMDWLHLFLSRNPELDIKKAKRYSQSPLVMSENKIKRYFSILQDILIKHELINKPSHIYNLDEFGFQLNNKPGHGGNVKVFRNSSYIVSKEKYETVSTIVCCNGEGIFLPPACIFKGKNEKPEYKENMPPDSAIYLSQKSTLITSDIFHMWLQDHFLPRKPEGKVVIILDGNNTYCNTVNIFEFAKQNDIILLCLPIRTINVLQPLNRAFFKSLKVNYSTAYTSYIKSMHTKKINKLMFGRLLSEIWLKSATVSNAVSGFQETGVIPFDPTVIPTDAYLGSMQFPLEIETFMSDSDSHSSARYSPQPSCSKTSSIKEERITPERAFDKIEIPPNDTCNNMPFINSKSASATLIENDILSIIDKTIDNYEMQNSAINFRNDDSIANEQQLDDLFNNETIQELNDQNQDNNVFYVDFEDDYYILIV